jgi:exodeoxyribonuclease VII large subunit
VAACARRIHGHGRRAILDRARTLGHLARAPNQHIKRHRSHLHQLLRELRATAKRTAEQGRSRASVHALVLGRAAERARSSEATRRRAELERLSFALAAHDPDRTLARGYALVESTGGDPLASAAAARAAHDLRVRFRDDTVAVTVDEEQR